MYNKKKFDKKNGLMILSLALLSACASTTTPTAQIVNDKIGYANKHFSRQSLPSDVAKMIPSNPSGTGFGQLTITTELNSESIDGKKESWKNTNTYADLGDGLVQRINEQSSNDIPYRVVFSLTYRGIVDLKWQSIPLNGADAGPVREIKSITKFDALPSVANKDFGASFTVGGDIQIMNFIPGGLTCKTTRTLEASEIYNKFSGEAIELDCQFLTNSVVNGRSKWVMLQKYGIALLTEENTSTKKIIIRVIGVNS